MSIDPSIRKQLIMLARRFTAWRTDWKQSRPTDWRPDSVRNPNSVVEPNFTDESAWELIADQLEAGCEVKTIELRQPRGKIGYVMEIDFEQNQPIIYIKIQLGSGVIFGRSFHYSYYPNKEQR